MRRLGLKFRANPATPMIPCYFTILLNFKNVKVVIVLIEELGKYLFVFTVSALNPSSLNTV